MFTKERGGESRPARRLPVRAAMRLSDGLVRFLLAAALAGAEVLEGHALFAVAMIGVCRPGLEGFCALLGAALGYLTFRGFVGGLRYVAACMMIYAVSLALGDYPFCRRRWFMPVLCAALNGLVGFVYQSAAGWDGAAAVGFVTEMVLTAAAVRFFRSAFDLLDDPRPGTGLTAEQTVGVLVLGAAVTISLARVTVAGRWSLGRVLCVLAVMLAGWKGRAGVGAAVGVAAGLAMDLAVGTVPCYILSYALPGLVCGLFSGRSRLLCALAYVLCGGASLLWQGDECSAAHICEIIAGTALFLMLPDRMMRRMAALFRREPGAERGENVRQQAARSLARTAEAFRAVNADLSGAFRPVPPNDGDAMRLFDRAAERVCAKCRCRERCWQQEYQTTRAALTDALGPMMDRGEGERADFPEHFAGRCERFDRFLRAANRELTALLCRRSYDSRVRESRAAVCAQYGQMARVLDRTAAELAKEPETDLPRRRLLCRRMAALGLEGGCAVWRDPCGHLRVEVSCPGAERLIQPGEVARLSALLDCPLCSEETGEPDLIRLRQKEPLMAVAAVAAADREGQTVSGDSGAWFKDEAGRLNVVLCDGMGSGAEARTDSECALSLLEKFLRAGLTPDEALATVGEALALRGEESGGFTTVDLLQLDLFTGRGAVYKLGAAPTYLSRGGKVERLDGGSLPAGVTHGAGEHDCFPLKLEAGDWVVMVSDGVSSGQEDGWLRAVLAGTEGKTPRLLADALLQESGRREGRGDDRTVMVLKVERRK